MRILQAGAQVLGDIVSSSGVCPDPAKVDNVAKWPTPSSVADVRQFLGLANCFRKFIRGYTAVAAPLTDTLKGYKSCPGNYTPPPLPELIDGQLKYEVDCITDSRNEGKRREYRVHSVGYNESTWEPVANLTKCPDKLQEFWRSKKMDCPHDIPVHKSSRA